MKATRENADKARAYLEDQGCFISEEAFDFLAGFIIACRRVLPNETEESVIVDRPKSKGYTIPKSATKSGNPPSSS